MIRIASLRRVNATKKILLSISPSAQNRVSPYSRLLSSHSNVAESNKRAAAGKGRPRSRSFLALFAGSNSKRIDYVGGGGGCVNDAVRQWRILTALTLEFKHPFGVQMVNLAPLVLGDIDLIQHLDNVADEQRPALRIERAIGAEQDMIATEEIDAAAGA